MRAHEIMTRVVITVTPEMSIREAARLLAENRISGAPVVDDEGRLLGMLTEGDLLRKTGTDSEARWRSWWLESLASPQDLPAVVFKENGRLGLVKDVMTRKVISVGETMPVGEIADLLERHRIKRVPVVYDGEILGIVSRSNLVKALASAPEEFSAAAPDSDQAIREAVTHELGEHQWSVPVENVIVNDGIVHLWSDVESADQARAMCVVAEKVPGVKAVKDHTICPGSFR